MKIRTATGLVCAAALALSATGPGAVPRSSA